ncbi:hypothetical protein DPMN_182533 [Dreissena polymorpha]|uniref:Fucolectin tachylectin-4 pentraxin-1 domain-containing protein n=1 Tax=Dreissena polymorpha TaxID=45954 RepID=A0A9D4DFT6_DREPO|nr:hypothetical protein DPMN_182533 [Dreissena polymorpha]
MAAPAVYGIRPTFARRDSNNDAIEYAKHQKNAPTVELEPPDLYADTISITPRRSCMVKYGILLVEVTGTAATEVEILSLALIASRSDDTNSSSYGASNFGEMGSATAGNDADGAMAVDDNADTCTHTRPGSPRWWSVTLDNDVTVNSVSKLTDVINHIVQLGENISLFDWKVYVGTEDSVLTMDLCTSTRVTSSGAPLRCDVIARGSHVMVVNRAGPVNICDSRIYIGPERIGNREEAKKQMIKDDDMFGIIIMACAIALLRLQVCEQILVNA